MQIEAIVLCMYVLILYCRFFKGFQIFFLIYWLILERAEGGRERKTEREKNIDLLFHWPVPWPGIDPTNFVHLDGALSNQVR